MDETRLLEVEDLAVQFRTIDGLVRAVEGVSFHVDKGETVAIVGESGSGKSVTALSIMRLVELGGGRIVSGSIRFRRRDGSLLDLARAPEPVVRGVRGDEISMVFQEPMTSLNPVLTIGRQIAEAVELHQGKNPREARAVALAMLQMVRIPEPAQRLDCYPHQLSGGMRQRAMIAMALACRPSLLIADEPTTALDVTIQAQILDLIKLLKQEIGMAVLFITHDMGVVAEMADRVVVMWRGRKVEEGPVERIFAAPEHPYTRSLLAAVPRLGSMRGKKGPERFGDRREGSRAPADPASVEPEPAVRRTEDSALLEVDELVVRFPVGGGIFTRPKAAIHAVEGVSFRIAAGETLALVGESGCGKSTTARTIVRLQDPTRGRVRFCGRDITTLDRRSLRPVRRRMQIIFQDPYASLNPRLSALRLVGEPLRIHGLARGSELEDRVRTLLCRVGLGPEHLGRFPHELSGGQRQRLCIARALALEPRLIVADEPLSALDVSIQAQIVDLLLELQEELGLSYLFVSHDLAVVERIAHRVAVMYSGRIVEIGPRRAVFEDPRHAYTKKLLAAVPVADPRMRRKELRLVTDEIPSPLRPWGFEPPPAEYEEVSPGHLVMVD
ncbi:MAG: ABC transporter ATP-binding protein [Geminicoccaceae bacterium]|nr:ABC transporter ATP-binding protein [Geminicoccaceae bacterium]MCS7266891.1 ABC transporter ATP-binding protein [Geminicoccaceae bacterium]MCX7628844.1 ABC transporter ATP-binding protein [Geminicoccaceae bacterium]MDW8124185.1 ABC transporter ATP-binding protein [Geminicoccaceae bacterium]MDW8340592.1 ABC transporter ATP-binding protein [Geminicoccaceae bacterium]